MLVIHSVTLVSSEAAHDEAWIAFEGGTVVANGTGETWRELQPSEVQDARGRILVPGFVDMHCHGGGAAAFDSGDEQLDTALAVHLAHGSTTVIASLVTMTPERTVDCLRSLVAAIPTRPQLAGIHLEGPFLTAEHKGAHEEALLRDPELPIVEAFLEAGDGQIRQVTMAPERHGAMAATRAFVAAGVAVAVGHCSARYDEALAAFENGASILTHAFNGMDDVLHRAPGPVLAAVDRGDVTLEIIVDGTHVHDAVIRMLFDLAPGRVALITDAMSAACAADGRYRLGNLDVDVVDGVARLHGHGSIAGSTLTMDAAFRRAVHHLGRSLPQAVAATSAIPAKALSLHGNVGHLGHGARANAVLLTPELEIEQVWLDGTPLPRA